MARACIRVHSLKLKNARIINAIENIIRNNSIVAGDTFIHYLSLDSQLIASFIKFDFLSFLKCCASTFIQFY
jgi:transposase-like protein